MLLFSEGQFETKTGEEAEEKKGGHDVQPAIAEASVLGDENDTAGAVYRVEVSITRFKRAVGRTFEELKGEYSTVILDLKQKILDTEKEIERVDSLTKEKSYLLSQSILQSIHDLNRQYNQLAKDSIISAKSIQKVAPKSNVK